MLIKIRITRQDNANYFKQPIGTIVQIDFEEYIAAVIGSEIGKSSLEACKAQAIAARTYAVNKGVLSGKIITDSANQDQCYKASRYAFEICKRAAEETEGLILCYNNKPINAVYSNSNGGYTVSAESKWGNAKPYLIEQYDPWDSATGHIKDGHGVGMSQVGAQWAADHNFTHLDILNFYYPGTKLIGNYGYGEINFKLLNLQKFLKKIKEEL